MIVEGTGENLGMFTVGYFSEKEHCEEAFKEHFLDKGKDGFMGK